MNSLKQLEARVSRLEDENENLRVTSTRYDKKLSAVTDLESRADGLEANEEK